MIDRGRESEGEKRDVTASLLEESFFTRTRLWVSSVC